MFILFLAPLDSKINAQDYLRSGKLKTFMTVADIVLQSANEVSER